MPWINLLFSPSDVMMIRCLMIRSGLPGKVVEHLGPCCGTRQFNFFSMRVNFSAQSQLVKISIMIVVYGQVTRLQTCGAKLRVYLNNVFMYVINSYTLCLLGVHRNTNNVNFLVAFIIKWICKTCTDNDFILLKMTANKQFIQRVQFLLKYICLSYLSWGWKILCFILNKSSQLILVYS